MSMKQCPKCGTEFDPRIDFCFRDGSPLAVSAAAPKTSDKIVETKEAAPVENIDLAEISQDISIDDLLDIKGVSLGLDIGGIDLGGPGFDPTNFGDFDLNLEEEKDVVDPIEESIASLLGSNEKLEPQTRGNPSLDEELGVEFDFENESDSDELSAEITGELDFDEFENTLDLDAEMLAEELEKEAAGMIASPLVGMEGVQLPMGAAILQSDDELLPGDTLDLELDLQTLEGIEQLKEEEERRKQRAVTQEDSVVPEEKEEESSSSSTFFLVAVLIGIIGTVAAVSFSGNENSAENEKQAEVKKETTSLQITPKPEKKVIKNVEDVKEVVEVKKPAEPAEKEMLTPAEEKDEKAAPKTETAINTANPGGMKLPTQEVPDKQKIIPSPKISTPTTNPKPKPKPQKKIVTPKKVTPKKPEPTVEDTVAKNDDGAIGLWGAAPATRCYVVFNSNVATANVFVNGTGWGKKVGQEIKVECNKKYRVKLQAEGYITSDERAVQSDGKKEFFFELKQ